MTRKGTPRPGNGGARSGSGPKPSIKPLKRVELDADTAQRLAELTEWLRTRLQKPVMSQAEVIAMIVTDELNAIQNIENGEIEMMNR